MGASKWDVDRELFSVVTDALQNSSDTTHSVPYDLIGKIIRGLGCLTPRVRQNVSFEYGLCIGVLGRENVCVLLQSWKGGALEIPSDVLGFSYIQFMKDVSERKEDIRRELLAAGYRLHD
jgi:hypothetical protein